MLLSLMLDLGKILRKLILDSLNKKIKDINIINASQYSLINNHIGIEKYTGKDSGIHLVQYPARGGAHSWLNHPRQEFV